ncbi:hypothetical protein U1Q18_018302 [Sarracenia purpurea var. burkii]
MEFKFRAIGDEASTYLSYFAEQALRVSYSDHDFGRLTEVIQNPHNIREAIRREIEKERIREEIITTEIARKRSLEAELKREILLGREMGLCRVEGSSLFSGLMPPPPPPPPPLPPSMLFESRRSLLHQSEGRSLEERFPLSLEVRLGYRAHRAIGGFETLPFHRNPDPKPKISKAKPPSEVIKEKVIFLANADGNLSGAKRKAVTPSATCVIEPLSGGLKKPKGG